MSTELQVFSEEKISIIKEMMCKNATKSEFELFLHMCQRLHLDPLTRQIYFIKFGTQMSIVVGIDGYRSIAERTGLYMPGREPTFIYGEKGELVSCTSYVKKWSDLDKQWHEIAATAFLTEYDTGKNQWAKGKHYMLAKTSEALALRKGFTSQLAGTNTQEEMEKAIIDVESTRSSAHLLPKPANLVVDPISVGEAIQLHTLIGDDKEYLKRILDSYKVNDFVDIDRKNLQFITERIEKHNKERIEKEMSNE